MPLSVGTRSVYHLSSSIDDRIATVTSTVVSPRRVRWRAEGEPPARSAEWIVYLQCDEDGAEEPWFGLLEGMLGLWSDLGGDLDTRGFELRAARWKIPRTLAPGLTFGGETSVMRQIGGTSIDARFRRRYVVEREENLLLPNEHAVRAVRLRFDEDQTAGDQSAQPAGTVWLAGSIGLVRMEISIRDHAFVAELVAHELGDGP